MSVLCILRLRYSILSFHIHPCAVLFNIDNANKEEATGALVKYPKRFFAISGLILDSVIVFGLVQESIQAQ